jgi:hypothetical protein
MPEVSGVTSWERSRGTRDETRPGERVSRREGGHAAGRDETDETVEVLRGVWTASGQDGEELAELLGPAKSCKNMQNVGFEDLAGSEADIREAWRATLKREGKLSERQGSVRDLVLGRPEHQTGS